MACADVFTYVFCGPSWAIVVSKPLVKRSKLIVLSNTQFLYIALVCFVILPVLALIVLSPAFPSVWCQHFDMPEYERAFGFKLGELQAPRPEGDTYTVLGVAAVDPLGALDRSGVRVGDVPRMYHGLGDFCGDLAAPLEGRAVELRVYNVGEARDEKDPWKRIPLRLRSP